MADAVSKLLRPWTAAAILQWLAWGTVMLLSLAIPASQYASAEHFHRGSLAADAMARAFTLGQRISANPQMWFYEAYRLQEGVAQDLLPESRADYRVVIGADGTVLADNVRSAALPTPVLVHREALYDSGRVVGHVELRRSLRKDLRDAAITGGICLAVGLALAWLLTRLPLARLRRVERELEHKAYHDDLTGLYNRDAFRRLLAEGVELARRDRRRLAVLYIDLDRFKSINDSLGHDAGDEALKAVADRLRASVRSSDVVARLSGDEFAILIEAPPVASPALADKVLERFAAPFVVGGRQWHLGCSVGVAEFPDNGDDADRLLGCADTAMLHAKASGRNGSRVYHDAMEESVLRRLQIEEDLRGALERREFVLHYQPLVDLRTGRLKGCEALLRWQHPQRGLLPPLDFIGALEEMGLIHAVGMWVLEEACRQMRQWRDAGADIELVSVNVSPLQFARQSDFVDQVRQALAASGLPHGHLQLELTEGTLMADSQQSLALLLELRSLGVTLAIDDFGTGYSSLAYLRSFPVSVLKIDRSFVRDMHLDPRNANLVKAMVQMAHSLDLSVTAEGIETQTQHDALRALGCDTGQGYGIGRPMPADRLSEQIKRVGAIASMV